MNLVSDCGVEFEFEFTAPSQWGGAVSVYHHGAMTLYRDCYQCERGFADEDYWIDVHGVGITTRHHGTIEAALGEARAKAAVIFWLLVGAK